MLGVGLLGGIFVITTIRSRASNPGLLVAGIGLLVSCLVLAALGAVVIRAFLRSK
jgi:hypothetical protein